MSDPTQTTPDNSNPQATPPTTPPDNTGGLTQADVDRIVGERLKRDRQAQEDKRKERFGGLSDDDVLALVEKQRKADEAQLSELQKAQAQIDAANKKALEAEQKVKDMEARILADTRRNVFEKAVTDNGADAKRVSRLYKSMLDEKGTEFSALFGDDATPDDGKLKAFVKQVQADFPEYFGNPGAGSPSNSGGVAPNSTNTAELEKQLKKKFGRM